MVFALICLQGDHAVMSVASPFALAICILLSSNIARSLILLMLHVSVYAIKLQVAPGSTSSQIRKIRTST